ncbi:MAG: 1-deoxy-D-xylulose-5-phosphate reductoisomerase, partial [Muribaculaceae bacterium]|nr:1-deoxy-D-xylulose-5-phosphate reductoisomerase [Muribaculaceae bacterium]
HYALEKRGNAACVINAANEIAVAAFLRDRISFPNIYETIAHTLTAVPFVAAPTFADYVASNAEARARAEEFVATH